MALFSLTMSFRFLSLKLNAEKADIEMLLRCLSFLTAFLRRLSVSRLELSLLELLIESVSFEDELGKFMSWQYLLLVGLLSVD